MGGEIGKFIYIYLSIYRDSGNSRIDWCVDCVSAADEDEPILRARVNGTPTSAELN